jgi:hypothetical protein
MCLIVDKTIHPDLKPRVAKKDLYVYKFMINRKGRCLSYYQSFKYNLKKIYKTSLVTEKDTQRFGFHAYKIPDIHKILDLKAPSIFGIYPSSTICKNTTLYLAKIPKGSIYYIGKDEDIVSDKLMLIEPLVSNTNPFKKEIETITISDGYLLHGVDFINCANQILIEEGYENQTY